KITYTHNYEMARAKLFNLKSGTGVFEHLESAYRVNPTSLYLHGLIIAAFEHEASRVNDVGQLDALITRYRIPFSFLDTNLLFNERRGSTILDKAYQQFMLNNTRKGLGYLREFEDACAATPNFGAYPAAVERA